MHSIHRGRFDNQIEVVTKKVFKDCVYLGTSSQRCEFFRSLRQPVLQGNDFDIGFMPGNDAADRAAAN